MPGRRSNTPDRIRSSDGWRLIRSRLASRMVPPWRSRRRSGLLSIATTITRWDSLKRMRKGSWPSPEWSYILASNSAVRLCQPPKNSQTCMNRRTVDALSPILSRPTSRSTPVPRWHIGRGAQACPSGRFVFARRCFYSDTLIVIDVAVQSAGGPAAVAAISGPGAAGGGVSDRSQRHVRPLYFPINLRA